MAPPNASTSFTKWPLPMPPIEGLHDICPSVSRFWESSSVFLPVRAEASAASVPAWPPPITITSKFSVKCIPGVRDQNNQRKGFYGKRWCGVRETWSALPDPHKTCHVVFYNVSRETQGHR